MLKAKREIVLAFRTEAESEPGVIAELERGSKSHAPIDPRFADVVKAHRGFNVWLDATTGWTRQLPHRRDAEIDDVAVLAHMASPIPSAGGDFDEHAARPWATAKAPATELVLGTNAPHGGLIPIPALEGDTVPMRGTVVLRAGAVTDCKQRQQKKRAHGAILEVKRRGG
jgi:hypothetical protein